MSNFKAPAASTPEVMSSSAPLPRNAVRKPHTQNHPQTSFIVLLPTLQRDKRIVEIALIPHTLQVLPPQPQRGRIIRISLSSISHQFLVPSSPNPARKSRHLPSRKPP